MTTLKNYIIICHDEHFGFCVAMGTAFGGIISIILVMLRHKVGL